MFKPVLVPLLLLALAAPAAAQSEAALKSYFEGRRVTLRMDMPGDADAWTSTPMPDVPSISVNTRTPSSGTAPPSDPATPPS